MADNEFNDGSGEDEYDFTGDDVFQFDDDTEFNFSDVEDELTDDSDIDHSSTEEIEEPVGGAQGIVSDFINKFKNEDPKQLIIPVAIGGFVIILVIYVVISLIGMMFSDSDDANQAQNTQQEISQPITAQQSDDDLVVEALPVPEQQAPVAQADDTQATDDSDAQSVNFDDLPTAASPKDLMDQIHSLEEKINELEEQNKNFDSQFKFLTEQNAQTVAQINGMVRGVKSIETQVMGLNNALMGIVKETKSTAPARASSGHGRLIREDDRPAQDDQRNMEPEILSYHVQAAIPGRAWLKTSNNNIVTVARGDIVPGYGKVISIDAVNGVVKTSQGATIEYGIDQF